MAELSKIFKSNELYEAWRNDKDIPSNILAVVLDKTGADVEKVAFGTNDITGEYTTYEVEKGETPQLQAVGYMFVNADAPLYEIGTNEYYPCDYINIEIIDNIVTRYSGNIYIKYNRPLTDEEVTAEKAKITGENIDMTNIVIRQATDKDNMLEIIWVNTDEYMSADDMTIYYDNKSICKFNNAKYSEYSNTGIILMGHSVPITQNNWKSTIEVGNIIIDDEAATLYPVSETGEYHIMIMTKNYVNLNLPISVNFCHGTDIIEQYPLAVQASFLHNGLKAYIFNFQELPTPSQIDTIEINWGNAYYKMNIV